MAEADTQDVPAPDPVDALMTGLGVGGGAPAGLSISPMFESNVQRIKPFFQPSPQTIQAQRAQAGVDFDILKKKQQQQQQQAEESDQLTQKITGFNRNILQQYQEGFGNKPVPTFVPSKASAGDFTTLGSLIAIAGLVVGRSKGMQPGLSALAAMTGMMNGWHQGQAEEYEKQRQKFQADWQTFERQRQDFMDKMKSDLEIAKTDMESGLSSIKLHAAESGSELLSDLAAKGQIDAIVNALQASDQAGQKAAELVGKIEERGMARAGISATPQDSAQLADMIAHYQIPVPMSGFLLRSEPWKSALPMAKKLNPDFQAQYYGVVQSTLKGFTTGTQGNTLRALTVAAQHIDTFRAMAQALKNNDVRAFNAARQAWAYQTGSAAPTNFAAVKEIVGREIIKAVSGSGVLTDRAAGDLEENMNRANSPEQLLGWTDSLTALIGGQLRGLKKQFNSGVRGTGITWDQMNFLDPKLEQKYFQSSETGSQSTKYTVGQIIEKGGKKYRVTGGDLENDPNVEEVK